jgi:large subunit ribosomal protein L21
MSYAIITVGGKQYRVREGERLLVDRLRTDEGATFNPRVLLVGGDGETDLAPSTTVTARVVGHVLGEKIRIGKYRKRTGYKRHNGHRSRLTRIEIEAIGGGARKPAPGKAETAKAPAPAEAAATEPAADVAASPPPEGYEAMKVAQISEAASGWTTQELEAALDHERAHAARKTAIAALESALAAKEGS